jgi:hypothetical protein
VCQFSHALRNPQPALRFRASREDDRFVDHRCKTRQFSRFSFLRSRVHITDRWSREEPMTLRRRSDATR